MNDPLGPIAEAPTVSLIDGEVVLLGERVGVSYTVPAAIVLIDRLRSAVEAFPAESSRQP